MSEQSLPPYGEPASRQLLTHLARREFPYGSPPVKRDVRPEFGFYERERPELGIRIRNSELGIQNLSAADAARN
jgi:hypothetical protein